MSDVKDIGSCFEHDVPLCDKCARNRVALNKKPRLVISRGV